MQARVYGSETTFQTLADILDQLGLEAHHASGFSPPLNDNTGIGLVFVDADYTRQISASGLLEHLKDIQIIVLNTRPRLDEPFRDEAFACGYLDICNSSTAELKARVKAITRRAQGLLTANRHQS